MQGSGVSPLSLPADLVRFALDSPLERRGFELSVPSPSVPLSHGGNTGSNPVGDANLFNSLRISETICVPVVSRRRACDVRSSAAPR